MAITATLGDVVRIGPILVKDSAGILTDPVTIAITFKRPDGTSTSPATPAKDGTGTYHDDYEPPATAAMAGKHPYRIVTVNPDAAYEDFIYFLPSPFAP